MRLLFTYGQAGHSLRAILGSINRARLKKMCPAVATRCYAANHGSLPIDALPQYSKCWTICIGRKVYFNQHYLSNLLYALCTYYDK